tara:strand:- start:817 stop:1962 length:1146 start_codon:yes stop_codon:yes gene_type:complete
MSAMHTPNNLLIALFTALTLVGTACTISNPVFDFDEDGIVDTEDCAPADPEIHPLAEDLFGDNIDQNCDGTDGIATDVDQDQFSATVDCDDRNPLAYPGAPDPLGDEIDQNCDGIDGMAVDLDQDQFSSAVDCDDQDPLVNPNAAEQSGDETDQNCDGLIDPPVDADGDGFPNHLDCDDNDPAVTLCPSCPETPQDPPAAFPDNLNCTEIFSDNLEAGFDGGFLSFFTNTQGYSWGYSTNQAHSSTRSLYFGDIGSLDYDGGTTLSTLTLNPIGTLGGGTLKLHFWVWADIDEGSHTDLLCARVGDSIQGSVNPHMEQQCIKPLYDFSVTDPDQRWQEQSLYFTGTRGEDAAIEFLFDTVDELNNSGEGVYIDDISLYDCS